MTENNIYLYFTLTLYLSFLIICGLLSKKKNVTIDDYFLSGRNLSPMLFLFIATATSFSGAAFLMNPAIIFRDGFQSSYISFAVIIIPLTGVLFLKRQWMLSNKFNYTTPGEMFYAYFKSKTLKILIVIIGLSFSIPFLGIQLLASGKILSFLSGGELNANYVSIVMGFILLLYVSTGGLRSIAYADILNCFLFWLGVLSLGLVVLNLTGGWNEFNDGLGELAITEGTKWNKTPNGNYSALFAIPDIVQITNGIPRENPVGGIWTVTMIFTYVMTFMGIQASPAFSIIAFSSRAPKIFVTQQILVSSFIMGIIFFISFIIIGMGSHLLGANPILNDLEIVKQDLLPDLIGKFNEGSLMLYLINIFANTSPIILSIFAVVAISATQSSGAIFIFSGATMLTKDILNIESKNDKFKKKISQIFSIFIVLLTLTIIFFEKNIFIALGGLSVAFSFQLIIPLLAICYIPWFTKTGIIFGLIAGLLVTIITGSLGQNLFADFLPWGIWPLTIYSAFWGMIFNLIISISISIFTQKKDELDHKTKFHNFLNSNLIENNFNKKLKIIFSFLIFGIWIFFALGPGSIIGNDIFGSPNNKSTWIFDIPSIWAWQTFFWVLGIFALWNLAMNINNNKRFNENN